jgi:hypothetical protein
VLGDGETEESYVKKLKEFNFFKNVNLKFIKGNEASFETKVKEHANNNKNVLVIIDVDNAKSGSKNTRQLKV